MNNLLSKLQSILPIHLIKKSGSFFITRIVGISIGFLFSWWITKIGGAKFWGGYTLYFTILNIFLIFCLFGLDTLLVKYISEYKAKHQLEKLNRHYFTTLFVVILISISLSIVAYSFAFLYIPFLEKFGFSMMELKLVIMSCPGFALLALNKSVYRGYRKMVSFGILKNIALIGCVFIITFLSIYLFNADLTLNFILQILLVVIYFLAFLTTLSLILNKKVSFSNFKIEKPNNLFKQSIPLMLVASMSLIVAYTDILMIGYVKSKSEVGIYDIAIKYSAIASIFLTAINAYAMPKFAEFFGVGNLDGLKNIVKQSSFLIFWTSCPFLIICLFFSKYLMSLYGIDFIAGKTALQILLISQFISSICGSVGYLLQMTNNQLIFQYIFLFATVINVVLNFILIPKYGINGAAIASLISTVFWNILSVCVVKKKLGFSTIYFPLLSNR